MQQKSPAETNNLILARLSDTDFKLLEAHLEEVELPLRAVLERPNSRIDSVYFLESGIASVVADGERPIEVGIIGREGMTGTALLLGEDRPDHQTFMQV